MTKQGAICTKSTGATKPRTLVILEHSKSIGLFIQNTVNYY